MITLRKCPSFLTSPGLVEYLIKTMYKEKHGFYLENYRSDQCSIDV